MKFWNSDSSPSLGYHLQLTLLVEEQSRVSLKLKKCWPDRTMPGCLLSSLLSWTPEQKQASRYSSVLDSGLSHSQHRNLFPQWKMPTVPASIFHMFRVMVVYHLWILVSETLTSFCICTYLLHMSSCACSSFAARHCLSRAQLLFCQWQQSLSGDICFHLVEGSSMVLRVATCLVSGGEALRL